MDNQTESLQFYFAFKLSVSADFGKKNSTRLLGGQSYKFSFKKRQKLSMAEKSKELLLKTAGQIDTFVKILGTYHKKKFWNEEVRNYMSLITFA